MTMLRTILSTCAMLSLIALGCDSPSPVNPPANNNGAAPTTLAAKPPTITLAPAGDATPPLDGGRVTSTMPEGWKFLPRSNDYLFAAYYEDKAGVPRMILKGTDAGRLPPTESAATAKDLIAKITSEIGDDKDAPLTVVNVGDNWFVRYEKAMKFRSLAARGIHLETVQAGKLYQIELLTYKEDKDKFLPALYRFAAGLKVESPADEAAPMEEPAGEDSPKEEASQEEASTEEPVAEE